MLTERPIPNGYIPYVYLRVLTRDSDWCDNGNRKAW